MNLYGHFYTYIYLSKNKNLHFVNSHMLLILDVLGNLKLLTSDTPQIIMPLGKSFFFFFFPWVSNYLLTRKGMKLVLQPAAYHTNGQI